MLVVIWKKYDNLVSYSEMFSIILKVICLFQITKGIYLLNVQNIMSIYGIGNLHISRMELHINIFVEPLIAFVPSKHTDRVLDMSVPRSDNTCLILSIITSDFVEEIDCNIRKSRQNDFFFHQNNLYIFWSFLSLQLRSLHLQTKQYPEHDKPFCLQVLGSRYSAIKERSCSYPNLDKSHFFLHVCKYCLTTGSSISPARKLTNFG